LLTNTLIASGVSAIRFSWKAISFGIPIIIPIAQRYGWRFAFLLTGFLGALWLILWWRVARPGGVRGPRGRGEQP